MPDKSSIWDTRINQVYLHLVFILGLLEKFLVVFITRMSLLSLTSVEIDVVDISI